MAKEKKTKSLKEALVSVDTMILALSRSLPKAASELNKAFKDGEFRDSPYAYHIPRMEVAIDIALTFSKQQVKGGTFLIFGSKRKEGSKTNLTSNIKFELVAVPNQTKTQTVSEIGADIDEELYGSN